MKIARVFPLLGGGFLLAVLWFDLKFDLLVYDQLVDRGDVDAEALASIKAYYTRALGTEMAGFPLIMTMMFLSIVATLVQFKDDCLVTWTWIASLLLLVPPILLAFVRVVPNAGRLADSDADHRHQLDLAETILQDHLFCFASISCFLVLQLYRTWEQRSATKT
jgi:hypothetical protein